MAPAILRPPQETLTTQQTAHLPEIVVQNILKYGHILFDDPVICILKAFRESRPVGLWEGERGSELVVILGEVNLL